MILPFLIWRSVVTGKVSCIRYQRREVVLPDVLQRFLPFTVILQAGEYPYLLLEIRRHFSLLVHVQ